MEFMTYEEMLARKKFREEIKDYSDKDLYLEMKSKVGLNNDITKFELIVLEKMCISKLSLSEIAISLEKPLKKIEEGYKMGIRKVKRVLFENRKEYLVSIVREEIRESERIKSLKSKLWRDYLGEMKKKSDLEIYNLIDRETMLKEKLFSERNLMVLEDLILREDTLKIVAERYGISVSRVNQIKDYCLTCINKYHFKLNNLVCS